MTTKYIVIGVLILLFAAGGIWYWMSGGASEVAPQGETPAANKEEAGLGAELFEAAQNPVGERMPDTNPFSADTNPFDAKTNPFEAGYKNPFK